MPNIVWAEDNRQDRLFIQVSTEGLEPRPDLMLVADGVLLLEALAKARPDLVVLDLKMPRMGGLETLRRIRRNPDWRSLPVVIFSSGNQPDEMEECKVLGVQEIVQKPVDFDQLNASVQRIFGLAHP